MTNPTNTDQSPAKAIAAAVVGGVATVLAALEVNVNEELLLAVTTLTATLLVYVVPNKNVR